MAKIQVTAAEIKETVKLLDPGEYNAFISEAEFKISGAGNPMIVLKVGILIPGKKKHPVIYDYIRFNDISADNTKDEIEKHRLTNKISARKLSKINSNLIQLFDSGEFDYEIHYISLPNCQCKVKIINENYNDSVRNKISYYIALPPPAEVDENGEVIETKENKAPPKQDNDNKGGSYDAGGTDGNKLGNVSEDGNSDNKSEVDFGTDDDIPF